MGLSDVHILAFGAHSDDVEIGMGGTIAKYAARGKKIVICDLTEAELSSNGNVPTRQIEAGHSAGILGAQARIGLGFPDRGLQLNPEYIKIIAAVIRKYQPQLVFAPYHLDRHPDHGNCARLVEEAVFSAAIKKFDAGTENGPHRIGRLAHYMINGFHTPDFVIDISEYMEKKKAALNAYKSQFEKTGESFETPLVNGYIESIEARELSFGKLVGTRYAEGFKMSVPPIVDRDLLGE